MGRWEKQKYEMIASSIRSTKHHCQMFGGFVSASIDQVFAEIDMWDAQMNKQRKRRAHNERGGGNVDEDGTWRAL